MVLKAEHCGVQRHNFAMFNFPFKQLAYGRWSLAETLFISCCYATPFLHILQSTVAVVNNPLCLGGGIAGSGVVLWAFCVVMC